MTTVLPDASAGATLCATMFSGELNDVIPQTTPRGTRMVNARRCAFPGAFSIGTISPVSRLASSAEMRNVWIVRLTSLSASDTGKPGLGDDAIDEVRAARSQSGRRCRAGSGIGAARPGAHARTRRARRARRRRPDPRVARAATPICLAGELVEHRQRLGAVDPGAVQKEGRAPAHRLRLAGQPCAARLR